jgi:hypothetical protein
MKHFWITLFLGVQLEDSIHFYHSFNHEQNCFNEEDFIKTMKFNCMKPFFDNIKKNILSFFDKTKNDNNINPDVYIVLLDNPEVFDSFYNDSI